MAGQVGPQLTVASTSCQCRPVPNLVARSRRARQISRPVHLHEPDDASSAATHGPPHHAPFLDSPPEGPRVSSTAMPCRSAPAPVSQAEQHHATHGVPPAHHSGQQGQPPAPHAVAQRLTPECLSRSAAGGAPHSPLAAPATLFSAAAALLPRPCRTTQAEATVMDLPPAVLCSAALRPEAAHSTSSASSSVDGQGPSRADPPQQPHESQDQSCNAQQNPDEQGGPQDGLQEGREGSQQEGMGMAPTAPVAHPALRPRSVGSSASPLATAAAEGPPPCLLKSSEALQRSFNPNHPMAGASRKLHHTAVFPPPAAPVCLRT